MSSKNSQQGSAQFSSIHKGPDNASFPKRKLLRQSDYSLNSQPSNNLFGQVNSQEKKNGINLQKFCNILNALGNVFENSNVSNKGLEESRHSQSSKDKGDSNTVKVYTSN